jgi:hypothetical protein
MSAGFRDVYLRLRKDCGPRRNDVESQEQSSRPIPLLINRGVRPIQWHCWRSKNELSGRVSCIRRDDQKNTAAEYLNRNLTHQKRRHLNV